MTDWFFDHGHLVVSMVKVNGEIPYFEVRYFDKLLGCIYPATRLDYEKCVRRLNCGFDPISSYWEDGLGHTCTVDGWLNEEV